MSLQIKIIGTHMKNTQERQPQRSRRRYWKVSLKKVSKGGPLTGTMNTKIKITKDITNDFVNLRL